MLAFVLPEFDSNTDTHFRHTVKFWNELAKKTPVTVLVEHNFGKRSEVEKAFSNAEKVIVQKFKFFPLNLVERFFILLGLRLSGVKKFYVHYSYFAAIFAGVLGGYTWYWHCETYENYGADKHGFERLRWKTTDDIPFYFARKLSRKIVTASKIIADFYVKQFGVPKDKFVILPNAIDLSEYKNLPGKESARKKLGMSKTDKVALFIHTLSPRKGALLLPSIIEKTWEQEKVLFVVVGAGPCLNKLLEWKKNLNTENQKLVRFEGKKSNKSLVNYYRAADIFIMPSRQEGMPRVILEALACGLPVLSSNVGNVSEIVGKDFPLIPIPPERHLNTWAEQIAKMKKTTVSKKLLGPYNFPVVIQQYFKVIND